MSISDDDINEQPADDALAATVAADADGTDSADSDGTDGDGDADGTDGTDGPLAGEQGDLFVGDQSDEQQQLQPDQGEEPGFE